MGSLPHAGAPTLRFSYQDTATLRIQGNGLPTWTNLGVNTFQYTQGQFG